jgi:hypothetical protein
VQKCADLAERRVSPCREKILSVALNRSHPTPTMQPPSRRRHGLRDGSAAASACRLPSGAKRRPNCARKDTVGARLVGRLGSLMRSAGLYSTEKIRPANETRFEARWKLGRLLRKVDRAQPKPGGKTMSRAETRFREYLKETGIDKSRAVEAQRIGCMPEEKLREAFAASTEADVTGR